MKRPSPLTLITAMAALAGLSATEAGAQQRSVSSGARVTYPSTHNFSWERGPPRFREGFGFGGGVWIVEREVPVYVEREAVTVEKPAANAGTLNRDAPDSPPAPPRKPYVIGASYASLPGGCMKLIEEGVSYYYCSGEWYRQVGEGRSSTYKAVARKL